MELQKIAQYKAYKRRTRQELRTPSSGCVQFHFLSRHKATKIKQIYYIKMWYVHVFAFFWGQTQIISCRCLVLPPFKIPGTRKTWPFRSFPQRPSSLLHLLVTIETHRRICICSFGNFTDDSLTVGYARLPSSISGVYIYIYIYILCHNIYEYHAVALFWFKAEKQKRIPLQPTWNFLKASLCKNPQSASMDIKVIHELRK